MATFYRADGWVKAVLGPAIAGAEIFVCNQPASLTNPPTPLATIYSDVNGVSPITQPIFTDGFGHYSWYAPSGFYTVVVVNAGQIQQVYTDQTVGVPGVAGGGTVTNASDLGLNQVVIGDGGDGVQTGGVLLSSLATTLNVAAETARAEAAEAQLAPLNSPAFTGRVKNTNAGSFDNIVMHQYMTSYLNGYDASIDFTPARGGPATIALSGGAIAPSSTTTLNVIGVGGFVISDKDSSLATVGNCTAVYGLATCRANGSAVWGGNLLGQDLTGTVGGLITGLEIDMGCNGTPTQFRGLSFFGVGTGTQPGYPDSYWISFNGLQAPGTPQVGLQSNRGAVTVTAILLDGLAKTNNTPSQRIAFNGFDSGGSQHQAYIQCDANGNLQLLPTAGGAVLIDDGTSWNPSPANLTQVGGAATVTGHYTRIGNLVFFTIAIVPAGGGNTSSSAGSTTFSLPSGLAPARVSVCSGVAGTASSLGNGSVQVGGVYAPAWTTSTFAVYISGTYELA